MQRSWATVVMAIAVSACTATGATVPPPGSADTWDWAGDVDIERPGVDPSSGSMSQTTQRGVSATAIPMSEGCSQAAAGESARPWLGAGAVLDALQHSAFEAVDVSASIWVRGHGVVVESDADRALVPASNQKLLTAIGAYLLLDPTERFRTEVLASERRLTLIAEGDPTVRSTGPHSLAELAHQVVTAGVTNVVEVRMDATAFVADTSAPGWFDWQMPTYVGPLSASIVDDNRFRSDPDYVADPARGNGEAWVEALVDAGVAVTGGLDSLTIAAHEGGGEVVATLASAPIGELVATMLLASDNEIAESLVRRIGHGDTSAGTAAIEAAIDRWCLGLSGTLADGSGLSRSNRRSANEWVALLRSAETQEWGSTFRSALPVAGTSGTLARRFRSADVVGRVQAKTGSIIGGRALSGYATSADGKDVVFSIVVNGTPEAAAAAQPAIDGVIAALVGP